MLPGIDGWQLLQIVRRKAQTPVLFLTARDAVEDRVKGLELGADDYLVKPFAFSELLARVRTLLRRGAVQLAMDRIQVADLILDLSRLGDTSLKGAVRTREASLTVADNLQVN